MDIKKEEIFKQLVDRGLAAVEEIHAELVAAFLSFLESRGELNAVRAIRGGFSSLEEGSFDASTVQAVSYYFQLLNLAEEYVANRMRREREAELGVGAEPGRWGHYFEQIKKLGLSPDEVREAIKGTQVEPVFTKHPTEAKRWSVLRIHREIVALLRTTEQISTSSEKEAFTMEMGMLMERLWLNGELFQRKPGVSDELENLMYYLSEILPATLCRLDQSLVGAWRESWPEEIPLSPSEMPRLHFGSWVGGDRDGHPLVTSDVTRSTLLKLRLRAIEVVRERLEDLAPKLEFAHEQTPAPEDMLESLKEMGGVLDGRTPWAAYVLAVSENLDTLSTERSYELVDCLGTWLEEAGAPLIAKLAVVPISRLLKSLGLHLARIDVRQNSEYYEKALTQILEAAQIENASSFPDWSEEQKLDLLNEELKSPRPLTHASTPLPAEANEARKTLQVLAQEIEDHGKGSVGSLIISMTRSLSDLLTVYLLCREVGLVRQGAHGLECALPVVPLFETYDDLECGPGITDAFLNHPVTRNSLRLDQGVRLPMNVMLGYSDSNKDTGILASQWVLQRAQLRLSEVGKKHLTNVLFFHGRGGTVGRGAGPTHRFLEAQPKGALDAGLRVTEQGEVIGQKYNTAETATTNLEALLAGTFGARILAQNKEHGPMLDEAMSQLSKSSQARYRKFLETPGFMDFYRQATPIDAIELSRIGSRPSRRTGKATLADLRAIPWVFSWNQSRFYLPGWYGVGSGLKELKKTNREAYSFISSEVRGDSFLRYLFYNVESSLASSDLQWITAYADLVKDETLRDTFLGEVILERNLTEAMLSDLFVKPLTERRPRFWKTLQLRDIPLDALHKRQIELLRQLRAELEPCVEVRENLLLVINAIASGLRTTG